MGLPSAQKVEHTTIMKIAVAAHCFLCLNVTPLVTSIR